MLQNVDSDHLPILLTVLLSPIFRSNKHCPSFNFQKARWDDFPFYFDSHGPCAEEYSSLFLSSAAAVFTSLTLMRPNLSFLSAVSNANIKLGGPLKWKKRLVKDERLSLPLIKVMKIVRLTSPLPTRLVSHCQSQG